jgi:hypothetical protein
MTLTLQSLVATGAQPVEAALEILPSASAVALVEHSAGWQVIEHDANDALGYVRLGDTGRIGAWLLHASPRLLLNGLPTPSLARLEPGDVLSSGRFRYQVVERWSPVPQPAPPALADKACPVCGSPLSVATVVTCRCGRVTHLENATHDADESALNCYFVGPCACGLEPNLEPRLVPEPHEKWLASELLTEEP